MAIYIPEDKISEIKNKADIVDVISEVVLLKRTGKNYVGLCPFHSEKAPSFTVSPGKQIFYCFGCTTGGNVFSFLMKHNGITFPDAAGILARQLGIELPTKRMSPEQKRRISERETLLAINRDALDYFHKGLHHSDPNNRPTAYLEKRGIIETIFRETTLAEMLSQPGSVSPLCEEQKLVSLRAGSRRKKAKPKAKAKKKKR